MEGEEKENVLVRDKPAPPPQTPNRISEQRGGGDQTPEPADREGEKGDEPGYTPIPEDLCLWEVFGEWVHANPGIHLDGGIGDDAA